MEFRDVTDMTAQIKVGWQPGSYQHPVSELKVGMRDALFTALIATCAHNIVKNLPALVEKAQVIAKFWYFLTGADLNACMFSQCFLQFLF